MRHRPVGLGLMGFQDALYKQHRAYSFGPAAVEFADRSMEAISYYAIQASSDLAAERGSYSSFEGSLWSRGDPAHRFTASTIASPIRGARTTSRWTPANQTMDWNKLARSGARRSGMRNSNVMAIAPTATIANITGVSRSLSSRPIRTCM